MIETKRLRDLYVVTSYGDVENLSAASALVRHGTALYVVADDQAYLARFAESAKAPAEKLLLFDENWPTAPKARKAQKADLEALAHFSPSEFFPYGALLAIGSGSRPNRQTGALLSFSAAGDILRPRLIDLSTLFGGLRSTLPGLNIEGAFVCGEYFVLLHRANKGDRRNAGIRFSLNEFCTALTGGSGFSALQRDIYFYALGEIEGIPFSFTDGAALNDHSFVFSAVAEDTADNYNDGPCVGTALGVADLQGKVFRMEALSEALKVEGIALDENLDLLLVTDADAPHIPARLLRAKLGRLS